MIRIVLMLLIALAAACSPRPRLVVATDLDAAFTVRPVFIGTTRGSDSRLGFGRARSRGLGFARLDISVPPLRQKGQIEWPKREFDPSTQFIATDAVRYADRTAFERDLAVALRRRTGAAREAVIYVHGFNNNFAEGVLRIAQLAEDFTMPGVAVHYSWPSAANPLGYAYDRDSTLFARDGLEALIESVERSGANRIIVVGHSLGSHLTMEVLRQMAIGRPGSVAKRIAGVILISPDIDVEVFRSQATRIGKLPNAFGIFVSKRDRALNLSARLTGQRARLGNFNEVQEISDLDVTIVDVTSFAEDGGHFAVGTSPALINIFSRAGDLETAFRGDSAGRSGLIPGTVLTVQNATSIIMSPVTTISQTLAQ